MNFTIDFEKTYVRNNRERTIIVINTGLAFTFEKHLPFTTDIEGYVIDAYCDSYCMLNIQGYSFNDIIVSYLENKDLNDDLYWDHD